MSAALIMEPQQHQQEEGADCVHARRTQNILKQKEVSDQLKDQLETDFSQQVFLPEDSSWRVQSVTPDSEMFCYEREISDYKEMMFNKDHKNWVGTDCDGNPVVISVCTDSDNRTTLVILRDIRETKSEKFDNNEDSDAGDVNSVLEFAKIVSPSLEIYNLKEIECEDIKEWIAINDENYNELLLRKNYTIGVLYQRSKQSSESEIFGNIGHCEKFEHFLRQNLGYSSSDDEDFIKTTYQDFSLKFYVSTLLPHSKTNSQQLARKARIGNCCVSIVFQAAEDKTIFSPEIITSQFLHVYVVVQPVGEPDHYKVSVVSKFGVPDFGPVLAPVEIINEENFEKFARILINAVQASYKTGKLAELRKKYKLAGLSQIPQKIEQWEEAKRNPERDETGWKCNLL